MILRVLRNGVDGFVFEQRGDLSGAMCLLSVVLNVELKGLELLWSAAAPTGMVLFIPVKALRGAGSGRLEEHFLVKRQCLEIEFSDDEEAYHEENECMTLRNRKRAAATSSQCRGDERIVVDTAGGI
jgi:hypothetical protein